MSNALAPIAYEHAEDILAFAINELKAGHPVALVVVTGTLGGSVRRPGAMMAVSRSGTTAGYVSGGCIDSDVALHAIQCIETGASKTIRYGTGSPFMDIQLPCGGGIDVTICPNPDLGTLKRMLETLHARSAVGITIDEQGHVELLDQVPSATGHTSGVFEAVYTPRLQLRLAGRGADIIATSRLASGAGIRTLVQSPDQEILDAVAAYPGARTQHISIQSYAAIARDDRWTAFLLMFHDTDLETPLLCDALEGEAFFIGAVGSFNAQQRRQSALRERGLSEDAIARIHGPVGLVPAMRDASMLAISALSQVISEFEKAHAS